MLNAADIIKDYVTEFSRLYDWMEVDTWSTYQFYKNYLHQTAL